jgi:hypothetical protein
MSEVDAFAEETNEVTLSSLNQLCADYKQACETEDAKKEELKQYVDEREKIESKILTILKEQNLPNFKTAIGTFSVRNNKSVAQPENIEEKRKLFDYLREQGIFEEMVNVNSRTLNSWAAKEVEAKEKAGVFGWAPPGLKTPTLYQSLSFRKK